MAQYEILRTLDRGGMAEVFLARLVGVEGFEKRVVLKRVLPHLSGDARFLQRFVDEARVAARLSHPNIVQIFELGEQHGQYFIAMEHVDGRNLKDVAKRLHARGERVPAAHAIRIGAAVLDALHYAHTRRDDEGALVGLVHRDVSPANVLVSFEGVVKLIDFGIARTTEHIERTNPGTVVGKAGYMSPEQMRGEPVDARTDVFACAATLFHVATGVLPFPGIGAAAVMHAVNHGQRRPYDEVRDVLDEELFGILSRGLAHAPEDRFESALAMQAAVERYASARGVASGTASLGEMMRRTFSGDDGTEDGAGDPETQSRVVTLAASAFTSASTLEEAPRVSLSQPTQPEEAVAPRRRSLVALAAVATIMAVLGGTLAWGVTGSGDDDRDVAESATATAAATETATAAATETATATAAATEIATATETATETATATEAATETETATATATATETATAAATERAADSAKAPDRATASAKDERRPPKGSRSRGPRSTSRRPQRAADSRAAPAPASLTLDSEPWSEVRVDGWKVGLTPLHAIELPAGRRELHLVNPDEKLEKRLSVTLKPGESRRMKVKLR